MRLLDILTETKLVNDYGWIDRDGGFHPGSHEIIVAEFFGDDIIRDYGPLPQGISVSDYAESEHYGYAFKAGWIRVSASNTEVDFEVGNNSTKASVNGMRNLIKDVHDRKIMIYHDHRYNEFLDAKPALRWINQMRVVLVTERTLLESGHMHYYGWIDHNGRYHEGSHELIIKEHFHNQIILDHGFEDNDNQTAVEQVERMRTGDEIYEYGFNEGWVRVYTEGGEIGFQLGQEPRRDAIRAVKNIVKDAVGYRIMLRFGSAWERFEDPKMAMRWLNQRFHGIVIEAPLNDFRVDPDLEQNLGKQRRKWHGYEREIQHFRDQDVKAIRSPKSLRKLETKFARIPQNINLYFWANPDPDYDWHTQRGEVRLDWIADKNRMGPEVAKRFARMNNARNRINIMMTGNLRDEGYIPMRSPWIMAHRMAHAITQGSRIFRVFDQFVLNLTRKLYGVKWPHLNRWNGEIFRRDYFQAYGPLLGHILGRMNSAKKGKLVQYREWVYERFAQYLMTGRVRLNKQLPIRLDRDAKTTPEGQRAGVKMIGRFEHVLEQEFERILNDSLGKFFVM